MYFQLFNFKISVEFDGTRSGHAAHKQENSMTKAEAVLTRLRKGRRIRKADHESILRGIQFILDFGATEDQAYSYARNFEEVSPHLNERVANDRMHKMHVLLGCQFKK
jgi:hypothetical protein